jgi:formylglycine-generating enzyme required for sulfatase activity
MGEPSEWAYRADGERPVHEVSVSAFAIDALATTNEHFTRFVDATGYVTDAERYGWSFVFAAFLRDDVEDTRGVAGAPWWRQVFGANWRHPEGPHSNVEARQDHPVVHVSWDDAQAYCTWSQCRLPTEAEWEYAARAGATTPFPWGDDVEPGGEHRMNVFQGRFPVENTEADGYAGTAPVDAYEPNGFGLYNVTGNVWEWCADWFDARYYARSPSADPTGPDHGARRVMRGGSYLCHRSYCGRYRVSARQPSEPASSTGNLGFRVAAEIAPL